MSSKKLTPEELTSKAELDVFLTSPEVRPWAQVLHTWEWGEYFVNRGAPIHRIAFRRDGVLVAAALLMLDHDRFGPFLYCARGPALDWSDESLAHEVLRSIRECGRELEPSAICLRLDPPLPVGFPATKQFGRNGYRRAGRFVQVERTWMSDLQPSWDEQIEWQKAHGMRTNIPRYLRRAERENVVIRESSDAQDLEVFLSILQATSHRKDGMGLNPLDYYRHQFNALAPSGYEKVFIAEHDGEPICAALIGVFGVEASYLWGGSLDIKRDLRAPHYMHFKIMRYAYDHGCQRYNFWGVVKDENHHPGYRGYGYSEFKRTFGGYVTLYQRTQDYIYRPIRYLPMYLNDRRRMHFAQLE